MTAPDGIRRLRRTARVARTAGGIYLGYKWTQRRTRRLDPVAADRLWLDRHERVAEQLYDTAIDLRGMFIKAGQFVGTRSDVFPAPFVHWLSQLQDRVPSHPFEVVRRVIEHDLKRPLAEIFESIEETPVASASLAQVHRAWLPSGAPVAVKVQYPEVGDLVRLDARNLRMMIRVLARREPRFDFRSVVNEITAQVPLELDFVREADLTRRLRRELAVVDGVVVPAVIDGLVGPRVLVTEYLEGVRMFEHGVPAPVGAAGNEAIARILAAAYGHQILLAGVFQADPHPGNILVLPGGRIGLLDFGLTKELPDEVRVGFARLVLAAAARDPGAIAGAFEGLGVRVRSRSPDDLVPLVGLFFDQRSLDGDRPRVQRRRALAAAPVEAIPGDLVLLGRVVGLLRGVCSSLGVPLSPMEMLRPYAERALAAQR